MSSHNPIIMHMVGQILNNKYKLIDFIAEGTFGWVFKAEHLRLHKEVAVKILKSSISAEEKAAFEKEAILVAALQHPNIIQVIDYDYWNNVPYLVMSYSPGGSLRDKYPKGEPIPLHTIVEYVQQIAKALQYAHDKQIIHRDIKPANCLLGPHGEVLISDFGIAIKAHTEKSLSAQDELGSPSYMSPEQGRKRAVKASDQYSLGVVVYEWLCGELPFQEKDIVNVILQHRNDPPPSLSRRGLAISAEVEQVVMKALAKNPANRFVNIEAFSQSLTKGYKNIQAVPPARPWYRISLVALLLISLIYLLCASIFHTPPFNPYTNMNTPTPSSSSVIQPTAINYSALTVSFKKIYGKQSIKVGIAHSDTIVFEQGGEMYSNGENCININNRSLHVKSFFTVIAVTTLSKTSNDKGYSLSIGNEELQGICLQQSHFNSLHPQTPLWVLVANIGTKENDVLPEIVPEVTNQIIHFARTNINFLGVVGFSFSQSVGESMKALNAASIPVISPAASSSEFSKSWPFFYRVVPDDNTEGEDAAKYATSNLNASSSFVFSDPNNEYSRSLAKGFSDGFGTVNTIPETSYRVSDTQSFKNDIADMAARYPRNTTGPVIVFCACYASDFSAFRNQIAEQVKIAEQVSNAIFMGGEALYELGSYNGNYSNVYFLAFAYPDTVTTLCSKNICTQDQHSFNITYCNRFDGGRYKVDPCNTHYGTSRPGPHVIQAYDATDALLQSYEQAHTKNTVVSSKNVQQTLSQLHFEGISGYIDFRNAASPSDPKDKAILVLYVNQNHTAAFRCFYGQFLPNSSNSCDS